VEGVTAPRTAIQTLAGELELARALLRHAHQRQVKLERLVRSLRAQVLTAREQRDAWKLIADREEARARKRAAS
jgi:hypothetical protein